MTFASPIWLWALPLLLAPPIIHWLFRRQHAVIQWGAVEILKRAMHRQKRFRRVEELLILLLRILAIAMLIIGLAQPELTRSSSMMAAARSPQFLLIDCSASNRRLIGSRTVFDQLRDSALEDISEIDRNRSVFLVVMPTNEIVEGHDAIIDRLRSLEAGWFAGDVAKTVNVIEAMIRDRRIPRADVHLYSDLQGSDFATVDSWPANWTVSHESLTLPRGENRRIESLDPGPGFPGAGRQWPCRIRLAGDPGPAQLSLTLDGDTIDERVVQVPVSGLLDVEIPVTFIKDGWHELTARIDDDTYLHDNVRHLAVRALARPRVVIHCTDPSAGHIEILKRALDPRREFGVDVTRQLPQDLGDVDLLVWSNARWPSADQASRISQAVESGMLAAFFPDEQTTGVELAGELGRYGSLGPVASSSSKFVPDVSSPYRNWHPYFHPFTFEKYATVIGGHHVLWRDDRALPVLVSSDHGLGVLIMSGFSLSGSSGDWIASPLYVGLLRSLFTRHDLEAFHSVSQVLDHERHDEWSEPGIHSRPDRPAAVNVPMNESDLETAGIDSEDVPIDESSAPQPLGLNLLALVFVLLAAETLWSTARQ